MAKISNSLGIIPARFSSSRFPGKPLADIAGTSMIMRVYENASKSEKLKHLVVATDDERIYNHVIQEGGNCVMTSPFHASGTDRCVEVVQRQDFENFDFVVNIQGDEPVLDFSQIDATLNMLEQGGDFAIATLASTIKNSEELHNSNVVKVLIGAGYKAIYFSRTAIPHIRGRERNDWLSAFRFYKHIGIYAFKRKVLLQIAELTPSPLEQAEGLEQLRWLENGFLVGVGITEHESQPVDNPDDISKVLQLMKNR
jgi:3-deoxy-manno-octulosonate cytidylyltransferase (CMP-KDO synthetase)